jgi:predicted nucleotide-binding protein
MARRTTPQSPQPAVLTSDQLKQGIQLLTKRLDAVEKFDPATVRERGRSPELTALRAYVEEALARTFGPDSLDYQRYRRAAEFYDGPLILGGGGLPLGEVHRNLADSKAKSIVLLQQAIEVMNERLQEIGDAPAVVPAAPKAASASRKVFIVHGHDGEPKQAVARFLDSLGFEAVILHEQANGGRTIIEKFEKNAEVGFAVVLLTPDDVGGKQGLVVSMLKPRARQNVVFELGYFIGRLGRSRVCALKLGDVEVPSDISGVVYVPYDAGGAWRTALGQELEEAGYEIDWNKVMRR